MKNGFATLIGMVIAIAILAFVMIKILSAQIEQRNTLNQTANPKEIQKQVDKYQNQLQQRQNEQLNQDLK